MTCPYIGIPITAPLALAMIIIAGAGGWVFSKLELLLDRKKFINDKCI
jgi:hypothetical protein